MDLTGKAPCLDFSNCESPPEILGRLSGIGQRLHQAFDGSIGTSDKEGRTDEPSLDHLAEADIRARCTEASFERGRHYYTGGAVRHRVRLGDGIEARVTGAHVYRVTVRGAPGQLAAFCTCPYDWGGDCKHIVATLLAWLREPESFRAPADLRAALDARSKADLVAILTDICAVYPHLVDEFGLSGEAATYDPQAVVAGVFAEMEPPGDVSIDEAVARLETVARHADRLARQGQGDAARRAYYFLTNYCKNFCETYGSAEIFPGNIPYDFGVAYRDLALEQLEEHASDIEGEVREMLRATPSCPGQAGHRRCWASKSR